MKNLTKYLIFAIVLILIIAGFFLKVYNPECIGKKYCEERGLKYEWIKMGGLNYIQINCSKNNQTIEYITDTFELDAEKYKECKQ